jgi:hypothetical protein
MKPKKIQTKLQLSPDCIRKLHELQENEPIARTAGRILEACVDYNDDFLTLLYLISHPKDKILREK